MKPDGVNLISNLGFFIEFIVFEISKIIRHQVARFFRDKKLISNFVKTGGAQNIQEGAQKKFPAYSAIH